MEDGLLQLPPALHCLTVDAATPLSLVRAAALVSLNSLVL